MRTERCSLIPVLISKLLLMTMLLVDIASSVESKTVLTASGTQSSSSDTFTSSRHKRAPGWGKRAPGWGKRYIPNEEFHDESENALEDIRNIEDLKAAAFLSQEDPFSIDKRAPGWGKRAPGWGKRAPGWGKRAPGWGKRSCYDGACFSNGASIETGTFPLSGKHIHDFELNDKGDEVEKIVPVFFKRAPGWGKRTYETDHDSVGTEADNLLSVWDTNDDIQSSKHEDKETIREILNRVESLSRAKQLSDSMSVNRRAPGWGKRDRDTEFRYDGLDTDKRAPGWGKRAPGWGKRSYQIELDGDVDTEKRAPGWGKRAPGWGKRSYQNELDGDVDTEKRAPGWGKRAPGWGKRSYEAEKDNTFDMGKRAPGWGKRAPGWGKRAPGWGKRAVGTSCQELENMTSDYIDKVSHVFFIPTF